MHKSARMLSAALIAALAPGSAWACGACALAAPQNSKTYLEMTLFMSAVPLLVIGGMIYWLSGRYSSGGSEAGAGRRSLLRTKLLPRLKLFSH